MAIIIRSCGFQRGGCKIIQFFNWMKKDGGGPNVHILVKWAPFSSMLILFVSSALESQNPQIRGNSGDSLDSTKRVQGGPRIQLLMGLWGPPKDL